MDNGQRLPAGQAGTTDLKIMGVLNVTPDSFSDGGLYTSLDQAVQQALRMEREGADMIDIGGESTRPGAVTVSIEEEINRVVPVIQAIRRQSNISISIDTMKAAVAARALEAGATMINDVSAGRFDPEMIPLAAAKRVPICLMHMQGEPRTMQTNPHYDDVVAEVKNFLAERIAFCLRAGVAKEKIVIDPGFGFGKRVEDNVRLLKELEQFQELGCPILVGTSRKSFIGHLTGSEVQDRLHGTLATLAIAVQNGASILRVHDVAAVKQFLKVFHSLR